jgi:tetratricopeptide (TPR) repeat protein
MFAQPNVELEKGDKAFDKLLFEEALYFYELAFEQQPADPAITRRIANTYRRMGQLTVSAEWYRTTLDLDASNNLDLIYYAEALKSLEQYDEAVEWYERYAQREPGDRRAASHLRDREYYRDLFADTLKYEMKKLGINTPDPVIGISHLDGNRYLLSAVSVQNELSDKSNEPRNYLDIYEVTLNSMNELVNPILLSSSVNSKFNDGPAYFSKGDQTLYITRNNIKKGKPVLDAQGSVNLKIYSSSFKDNQWGMAEELKINNDEFSSAHASLSRDGQFIYFSSNRSGGHGGTDLYMAQRISGGWTEPVNLGPKVNTEGNEMFPFLSQDNLLYFTSDGHAGLGGSDIFVSEKIGGNWQQPINLGAPINSNHDDFNLVYDRKDDRGFFCSNRSGRGNDDLFYYSHKKIEKTILAGSIRTKGSSTSLAGERIRVVEKNSGIVTEQRITPDQRYNISAEPGDRIAVFMANEEYFDTKTAILEFDVPNPILDPYINVGEQEVEMKQIPLIGGTLMPVTGDGLAEGSKTITPGKTAEGIVADKSRINGHELLNPVLTNNKSGKTDQSSLIVANADISANAEKTRLLKENLAIGDKLRTQGKLDEAMTYYREALKYNPNDPYALARIAEIENPANPATSLKSPEKEGTPSDLARIDFESTPSLVDLRGSR